MSDDPRLPYTVRGERKDGVVTFRCPTAEWALRKLADYEKAGYINITVTGSDSTPLSEAELNVIVANDNGPDGGAPVDLDVPTAPALAA